MVNAVYQPDELMPAARKLAGKIAGNGPIAVRMALECALEARMELEAQRFGEIFNTRDLREGLGAFVEKRKPEYRGE